MQAQNRKYYSAAGNRKISARQTEKFGGKNIAQPKSRSIFAAASEYPLHGGNGAINKGDTRHAKAPRRTCLDAPICPSA